ncbi:gamma-aminobutyric acid receptor subunit rho-1-like [Mizuhopecten yessoensis]|uniref:gamma-aminobutyric acid receptor subunit rho-1-like n=1 Tax=Mizuhopecten yessoensis TaxID=6573 RepID=UPI000B458B57|nr:gamma-aminobutyric acid receptor subunit rho-1-like [Mizuhopecten yessoensis]
MGDRNHLLKRRKEQEQELSSRGILGRLLNEVIWLAAIIRKMLRYQLEAMLQKDNSKPPFYHTGYQTKITITAHMTQMRLIDTSESDFTFYYYQIWNDPRLKFPFGNNSDIDRNTYHVVRRKYFGNIWLAESYIENELRSHIHDSSMSNRFVWLLSNGTVVYSMRMTVGLSCDLRGVLFPNGLYDCLMKFRIHSYTTDQVSMEWDSVNKPQINVDFDNSEVAVHAWQFSKCSSDTSAVVDSSCLQLLVNIHFSFASNAARLFLPSIFIVLVGWLSFWIERSEVSSRVKLGTLCLLAMITEQVGTKLLLPVEFNISSVEVWFVMSLTFVVVAMFEYTFVHAVDIFQEKVKRQEEMKKKIRTQTGGIGDTQDIKQRSNVDLIDMNTLSSDGSASGETTGNRNDDLMNTFGAKYIMMVPTGVVEKYFRILYPVAYLFFQFLFWTIYLNYEEVYE